MNAADLPATIRGFFYHRGDHLSFTSDAWSLHAAGDRGWVSFQAGGVEFLHADTTRGGFVFTSSGKQHALFPDRSTITADDSTGRMGLTGDGLHVIKWTPHRTQPQCDLYFGANRNDADLRLQMHLHPDVVATPDGSGGMVLRRGDIEVRMIPQSPGKDASGAPRPGPRIERVESPPDHTGGPVLAIAVEGFAPNTVRFDYAGPTLPEVPLANPSFAVTSSSDPASIPGKPRTRGPVPGVINPLYGPDTRIDFGIRFNWKGTEPFEGRAELEVVHALGGIDYQEVQDIRDVPPGADGHHIRFKPVFRRKGVSDVWVRLADRQGRLLWTNRYRMAWDWPNFQPDIRVEPDFEAFWRDTLARLRSTPLDARTERVARFEDAPDFEIYQVEFHSWEKRRIYAMLFVPRGAKGPLPAIVTSHPATTGFGINRGPDGVYGSKIRHDPRFVTIVPLIRGYPPDSPDVPFNQPWWGPLGDRDSYVARSWYCAMVRAVDYLATRPELVDMSRVVVRGGSQGGALALVLAGLDQRIAACISDCPANGQPHEIMNHYGGFGPSRGQVPPYKTVDETLRALSYYNPVNFAPLIRCPTHIGSNIGDLTVHSMGPLAAYQNLTGLAPESKGFHPGFVHDHGSGPGLGAKAREILEKFGGALPDPSSTKVGKTP